MNAVQKMIKEICAELGISFSLVSKDWIMLLQKEGKLRMIVGYKFDLNNHASGLICDDKFALYEVLKHEHIPVVEHFLLFQNYKKEEILEYAQKYAWDMVVKDNTGTCGNDMFHTTTKSSLFLKIDTLLLAHASVSISPFYKIKNEYRVVVLKGEVVLFSGKKKPMVVGDGKSSIYELLCCFNPFYFSKLEKTESLSKILSANEMYEYNWQFNLSKGAIPFLDCDAVLQKKIERLALAVAKILDLSFASIDIIETEDHELLVLEVNSGVMIKNFVELAPNGEEIARNVYKKAIEEMFRS